MSCFDSESHLSEASTAPGDPSREGDYTFFTFFIGVALLSHKIKMNFFSASFRTHF